MRLPLLSCLFVQFVVLPSFAIDSNEIARAIADLGATNHRNREAASRFLANAGREAVPALEKAAQSSDPEIRLRAQELLPSARLGIPPDFPAELQLALMEYPKATLAGKTATVERLIKAGRPARKVLIELARSEPNFETRIAVFGPLLEPVGEEIERRIKQPNLDDDAIARILEGLELTLAILPEATGEIVPQLIQRLDTLDRKKTADDLFNHALAELTKQSLAAPKDPQRHNNIAWLCAVSRRRLDEGLKHIELALVETPDDPPLLDTQAELYFQQGNQARALELIAKCIERAPAIAYFKKQQERMKRGDKSVPPPEPDVR